MANTKKFKLVISKENINEVLELLEINSIKVEVELPDTKETIVKLTTTEGIIDWDFDNETEKTLVKKENQEIKLNEYLINLLSLSDFNDLSTLIEAIRRTSKIDCEFGGSIWKEKVIENYNLVSTEPASFDHMTMRVLCESFYLYKNQYSCLSYPEIVNDLLTRLESLWSVLSNYTMSSEIAKALFGK